MHTTTVKTNTSPSTVEAPGEILQEPAYITALLGNNVDGLPYCPELIRILADALSVRCQVQPEAVVATALATAAAAMGPGMKAGDRKAPFIFNVIISHNAARSLPWFDLVIAPFLGRVLRMQANLSHNGRNEIERINKTRTADLHMARKTVGPRPDLIERLEAEVQRGAAELKPLVATSRLLPKEIGNLLPQSFDYGLVSVAAGTDPGEELLRMKLSERADLAELLNRSWYVTPLTFGSRTFSAVTSLLWQTTRPAADLSGAKGFGQGSITPPVLYLSGGGASRQIPMLPEENEWNRVIGVLFDHRCLNREVHYTFTPEAQAGLDQFADTLDAALPRVPEQLLPHVSWLPELCERIAPILWVLEGKESPVEDSCVTDAIAIVKWLGRQHLRTLTSANYRADTTASADDKEAAAAMFHKIRIKGPLTRRQLRRCYNNPQENWFSPLLEGLLTAGKLKYIEDGRLIACIPGLAGSDGSGK